MRKVKTVELRCANKPCNKVFNRYAGEHTRSLKLGRLEFCSRVCQGIAGADNLGEFKGHGQTEHLRSDNRRDDHTGFRYYVRKATARWPESNISAADVKAQWELQQGRCAYTGLPLTLKNDKTGNKDKKAYEMASLDRIDSSKPYDRGNIQFVSLSINLMKASMTDAETKQLIALIRAK